MPLSHNKNEYVKPHNYDFHPVQPQQAVAQLKLLGYKPGNTAYLRLIDPRRLSQEEKYALKRFPLQAQLEILSENEDGSWVCRYTPWDKWEETDKLKADGSPKSDLVPNPAHSTLNWVAAIERVNREGYGVYFSINKGGTKADQINVFTAAFFESDEGSISEQLQAIAAFMLEPTMVVTTRKSVHTYFSLKSNDLTSESWTHDVQRPMIMAMNSDPAIDDPSRIMRLAGFNHAKWNSELNTFEFVLCELQESEAPVRPKYTVEEVKAAVEAHLGCEYTPERYTLWKRLQGSAIMHVEKVVTELGFDYQAAREAVKKMSGEELELYARRYQKFHNLCLKRAKGADVNPMSAWEETASKLPQANLKRVKYEKAEFYDDVELGDADTIRWAQYMPYYNPNGRPGWITCQCPSVPEADREKHHIDSLHINKQTGAIKSQRGADAKFVYQMMKEIAEKSIEAEFQEKKAAIVKDKQSVWESLSKINYQTYKPYKVINERYLSDIEMEKGYVYVVVSPKNTGKTTFAARAVQKYENIHAWYTRIMQGEEQCARLGLEYKRKPGRFPSKKVGFCANSSPKHNPDILIENGLLLIDEFNQIPDHVIGETCKKNRQPIYNQLENSFSAAVADGNVLCMSADIKNRDMALIHALAEKAGAKGVRLIVNEYKFDLGTLKLVTDSDPYGAIEKVVELLQDGKNVMLCTDIKEGIKGAKTLAEQFRKLFPGIEIIEIHGDCSQEEWAKHYMKNINELSLKTRLLIVSPSLTNGVSIDNNHFDVVFGIMRGVLTVDDATQQIARVRNCKEVWLWAAESGVGSDEFADEPEFVLTPQLVRETIKRNYEDYATLMAEMMVKLKISKGYSKMEAQYDSHWFTHYCNAVAYRNYCKDEFRNRLIEKALLDGFSSIEEVSFGKGKDMKAALTETSERIEIAQAIAVANAKPLDNHELESLLLEDVKTPEQQARINRTILERSYGDAIVAAVEVEKAGEILNGYSALYIKDKKLSMARGWERARFLLAEDGEEQATHKDLHIEGFDFKQEEFMTGRMPQNLKFYTLSTRLLKKLKVDHFLKPDSKFKPTDTIALFKLAKQPKNCDCIKRYLGINPKSYDHQTKFFKALMAKLGFETQSKSVDRVHTVQIKPESWHLFELYLEHKAPKAEQKPAETRPEAPQKPAIAPTSPRGCKISEEEITKLAHNYLENLRRSGKYSETVIECLYENYVKYMRNQTLAA